MTIARHVHRIYIRASVEEVWNALIDPAFTRQYFHDTAFDKPPVAGEPFGTSMSSGVAAIRGIIEVLDPPHRLVHTWSMVYDPELAAEPPSRVEWTVTAAGDGLTRLDVVHGDLAASPKTWVRTHGWGLLLDSLKTLLETGSALPPSTDEPDAIVDPAGEWHRSAAIMANNSIWELLAAPVDSGSASAADSGPVLDPADGEELLRRAYAAAYHWDRAARRSPQNAVRADYMLAKAWVSVGDGVRALGYADRCLAGCAEHGLADFDLAYAHEARARSLACVGRCEEASTARTLAAGVAIADPEDQALFNSDLAAGPWFGLP